MPSVQRSIRVPEDLNREIRREMEFRGEQDWSKGAISLLSAGKDHRIMVTYKWVPEGLTQAHYTCTITMYI
jgi:hypothetical protein